MGNVLNPKFDLHVHTTASDGSLDAMQIIAEAKRIGLKTIAITDHDTIGNLKLCIEEGAKNGIRVIPGVEMSAEVSSGKMHILGFGINPDDEEFNKVMEMLREARMTRNLNIIETLNVGFDIHITFDDVKKHAKGQTIGKPHIAAAIVDYGYASNVQDAFDKYLNSKKLDKIDRKKLPPKSCIELINKAGGIAVLAHPTSLKLSDDDLFKKFKELKNYGLVGIEAYHSNISSKKSEIYKKMATELGLVISCGSDFHGLDIKNDVELGRGKADNIPTNDESIVKGIIEAIENNKK